MKILVINSGSSSLRYKLFNNNFEEIAKGTIERIGLPLSRAKNHKKALEIAFKKLLKEKTISDFSEISAVGHRVVHGGEDHTGPIKIDRSLIREIKRLSALAPLHNPPNLEGILACKKLLHRVPQVAIFDTAFHTTMPKKAFLYAIPEKFYKKFDIRRYGFHGTSHKYVTHETLRLLRKPSAKIISCHLGNGSSITATKAGKSIDTSMGFTPLEGLPMGTRSGSIDPGIIFHLLRTTKLSATELENILQHESGLKALSKTGSDMRKIYARAKKSHKPSILTLELLAYRIAKQIGAYTAALSGVDAIIFTGGIGENAHYVRKQVCTYLEFLGLKLDPKKNTQNAQIISTPKSKIKVFVIPTNEELQIAKEVKQLFHGNNKNPKKALKV